MSRLGVGTNAERFKGEMTNVSYDERGVISLTRDNLIPWGDLVAVNEKGNPLTATLLDIPGAEAPTQPILLQPRYASGFNLYAGYAQDQMTKQNDTPFPYAERSVFHLAEIREEGDHPPTEDEADVAHVAPAARLSVLPNTTTGFRIGTFPVKLSGVDEGGRHTLLSPEAFAVIPSASTWITFTVPDLAKSYAGLGIWMPYPTDFSVYYLQDILDLREAFSTDYTLKGPFAGITAQPAANETFLGETAQPILTEGVSSNYDLDPGLYEVYATLVTTSGEALANPDPAAVEVLELRAHNTITAEPSVKPDGVTGWYCHVKLSDGNLYVVYPADSTPERPLALDLKAEIYSLDPGKWAGTNWAVSPRDLPEEDASGLPDLTAGPMNLVATPATSIPNGSVVYVQIALTEDDAEGPRGPVSAVVVSGTNKMVHGVVPKLGQLLPNATGLETDPDGLALEHTARKPASGGTVAYTGGEIALTMSGATTGEAASNAIKANAFDRTATHAIEADLEVRSFTSGKLQLVLMEFSSANPSYIGPTTATLLRTTTLLEIDDLGEKELLNLATPTLPYTIPPSFWLLSTQSYLLVVRITDANGVPGAGGSRFLSGVLKNLAIFPHEHTPQRWVDPPRGVADLSDAEAPPSVAFPEGGRARIGRPKKNKLPPQGEPIVRVRRPLQVGTLESKANFDATPVGLPWTTVKRLGGANSTNAGLTAALETGARIDSTYGLHIKDTTTGPLASELGIDQVVTLENRHRMGIGARLKMISMVGGGARTLLELSSASGQLIGIAYMDTARHLYLNIPSASMQRRATKVPVPAAHIIDLDLTVSGAGTRWGTVSLWGASSLAGTAVRTLLSRFERVDLRGLQAQKVFAGIKEGSASGTQEAYMDSVKLTDGGQRWYRDHNALGQHLGIAHLFIHKGAKKSKNVFLTDIEVAVKPGQRYGLGCFFEHIGVKALSVPFQIVLHRLNGSTLPMGSLLNGGAGVVGSAGWREHLRDVVIPAYNATNPLSNVYKMTIKSRDMHEGTYIMQELGMSELDPSDALQVKRTGKRATLGTYRVTLFTETPGSGSLAPRLPRRWVRPVVNLVKGPNVNSSFAINYRTSKDTLTYTPYTTNFSEVLPRKYLEFYMVFAGNGFDSVELAPNSPALITRFYDSVLLREDGSEFPGGALVTGFSMPYGDPQVDIRPRLSGHNYRQPVAPDVPWLDPFTIQFFTKDALSIFRRRWSKEIFQIESESTGDLVKIKILDKPATSVAPQTCFLESTGDVYNVYASVDVDECEVMEATIPPGLPVGVGKPY